MNKIIVALVLVAGCTISVALAGRLGGGFEDGFEGGFEGGFQEPIRRFPPRWRRGRRFRPIGGFAAGGGALHSDRDFIRGDRFINGFDNEADLRNRGIIEGQKSGLIAGQKDFDAGFHDDDSASVSGFHNRNNINKDKLIVKDTTHGTSETDGFTASTGHKRGGHIRKEVGGLAAGSEGGRIVNENDARLRNSGLSAGSSDTIGNSNLDASAGGVVGGGALL